MDYPTLTIREMVQAMARDIRLHVVAGSVNLSNQIIEKELHRPGLLLAGFTALFPNHRIQLMGNTEMLFLKQLELEAHRNAIDRLIQFAPPCIIVTNRNRIPPTLKVAAESNNIPLISSSLSTNDVAFLLSNFLNNKLSPSISIHATLVDVYGTGLLFEGRAGIGKSEIALDLVERGHRLVADDVVTLTRKLPGILIGRGSELLKHMIEIRGVGIIDVREIFGVRAIRMQKRVEIVVELMDWDDKEDYERLGLDEQYRDYLGMKIPLIKLPIYPGKNITVITEAIALNLHLKIYGYHAAREFDKRLRLRLRDKQRIDKYLRWDSE